MLLPHFSFFIILLNLLPTYKKTFEEGSHNAEEKEEHAIYFPHGELLVSIPKCSSYGPHYFSLLLFFESK